MKVSALLRQTARRFTRAGLHYGHGTHNAMEEAAWLISSVLGYLLEEEVNPKALKLIGWPFLSTKLISFHSWLWFQAAEAVRVSPRVTRAVISASIP